ncbi:MAG: Phage protein [Proteiniphilum sp.]|nr:Phage protein [Proteiniphilum sp.]
MAGDETNSGWISIYRRIREHWIWQDPVKFKWWIDIILTVNHEDKKVNIGMRLIECKRGQAVMSLRNWADRWKVSRDSTRNFLELLKKDGMITTENLINTTRITVCNYDDYQGGLRTSQTQTERQPNASQTPADTNNNFNNSNNIISEDAISKIDVYPFDEFWNDYDKKRGSKEKLIKKWNKISDSEKLKIKEHIPIYKKAQPDKVFRKDPETFLNNKSWNDEIITSNGKDKSSATEKQSSIVDI